MILSTIITLLPVSIILIPILLILCMVYFHNIKRTIFYIVFSLYLAAVYIIVGLPDVTYFRFELSINLVPFIDMISDFINTVLNVILFIPLGIMLPLICDSFKKITNTLFFGFLMTLTIEVLQIFTFRITDINDIITNTLGTLIGYGIAMLIMKTIPKLTTPENNKKELFVVCGTTFLTMFFVQPLITVFLWLILNL